MLTYSSTCPSIHGLMLASLPLIVPAPRTDRAPSIKANRPDR
jgi:hypothetical protein